MYETSVQCFRSPYHVLSLATFSMCETSVQCLRSPYRVLSLATFSMCETSVQCFRSPYHVLSLATFPMYETSVQCFRSPYHVLSLATFSMFETSVLCCESPNHIQSLAAFSNYETPVLCWCSQYHTQALSVFKKTWNACFMLWQLLSVFVCIDLRHYFSFVSRATLCSMPWQLPVPVPTLYIVQINSRRSRDAQSHDSLTHLFRALRDRLHALSFSSVPVCQFKFDLIFLCPLCCIAIIGKYQHSDPDLSPRLI